MNDTICQPNLFNKKNRHKKFHLRLRFFYKYKLLIKSTFISILFCYLMVKFLFKMMEMQLDEVFAIIMEEIGEIGVCLTVRFY